MKTKIVSLFLKREHLILLSKMLQLTDYQNDQEQLIFKIDVQNQKSENRILKTERWPQQDLDYFQNSFLQIANLSFSYFKFHFPVNSALQIKEHIKFIQTVKQINYGGVTIEEVFKQQRSRLTIEVTKITKQVKLAEEPIMPKIMNQKMDLNQIQSIQERYFYPKNIEYMSPYQILNLKQHIPKVTARPNNKELYQSITSVEDIPPFQFMNSNLIQPILNYETFKSSYDYKFNKLMHRNLEVSSTIKRYQQKIKSFEVDCDVECIDTLSQLRRLFYSQIKAMLDRKVKDFYLDSNCKYSNAIESLEQSLKPSLYQSEIIYEENRQNQIQQQQEIQIDKSQVVINGVNQELIYSKLSELRKTPKILKIKLSPKLEQDPISLRSESFSNLMTVENSIKSVGLIKTENKSSQKSLELRQSMLISTSTFRQQKKLAHYQQNRIDEKIIPVIPNVDNNKFINLLQSQQPEQLIEQSNQNQDVQQDQEGAEFTTRKLQQKRSLDRLMLRPIAYNQPKSKDPNQRSRRQNKETSFPFVREALPKVAYNQIELETSKQKDQDFKQALQISSQRRFQTCEKDESSVKEVLLFQKKNNNMKHHLQNQLILLTRSEQILTTLMSNGQIRGTELYQQLLQPIKVSSSAKFLTPKSNNLISRTKFKKLQQESKMFSLK